MTNSRVQDASVSGTRESLPCDTCPVRGVGLCAALLGAGLTSDFKVERPRRKLCREGDPAEQVLMLCEGWAFRFTMLADGRRQILDFLLPGQIVSLTAPFKDAYDASVQTLTRVRYARIDRAALVAALRARDGSLLLRMVELCVSDLGRLESSLADLGRRSALERVARLLLSIYQRMTQRNRVVDGAFEFPVRQEHIADAVGLTPIHVGRMLRQLREMGVIRLQDRQLRILNMAELERIAEIAP